MSFQLQIDYPETLPDALQQTREEFENQAKWAMAVNEIASLRFAAFAMTVCNKLSLLT